MAAVQYESEKPFANGCLPDRCSLPFGLDRGPNGILLNNQIRSVVAGPSDVFDRVTSLRENVSKIFLEVGSAH